MTFRYTILGLCLPLTTGCCWLRLCRNGERWYRLRSGVQQLMMRPREVSSFLPLEDTAARALADRIDRDVTPDGELADLTSLIFKWALECEQPAVEEQLPSFD